MTNGEKIKKHDKRGKKRGRKLKAPCLLPPTPHRCYHPSVSAVNRLIQKNKTT